MKGKRKKYPYLTELIMKLAPRLGARVIVEPEWGIVAQIIYPNKVVRSMRMYSIDLNTMGSSSVAKDKGYSKFFMAKKGYPVAPGDTVFSDDWARVVKSKRNSGYAVNLAEKLRYPVIIKPNSKSQGTGVMVAWSNKELLASLKKVFKIDQVALLEKFLPGRDYRIVVLDGEVISAYERISLSVIGDGKNSIKKLLLLKQKEFIKNGRDTKIKFSDSRIAEKLKHQGYALSSVLPQGVKIYLLDNANLSTGGDSTDVTHTMHKSYKKIAINLSHDMGLRVCGVDLMVTYGDITHDPKNSEYYVIEINSAPGLDHYVTTGKAQKKIVEDMYMKVLKALGKKN